MDNGYPDINGETPLGNDAPADTRRQSAEERRRAAQERIEARRLAREKERETNPRKRKTIVELTSGTSNGKSRSASKVNANGGSSAGTKASNSSRSSSAGTSRASKPRATKASEPAPDPSLKSRYVTEYQHVGGTTPLTEEMLRAMPKKRRKK